MGKFTIHQLLTISLIFTAAFWIRIEYINETHIPTPLRSDARQYVIYGYNLAYHHTFSQDYPSDTPVPDSFRSPGYPLLIAAVFLFTENFYPVLLYIQALLSSLLVVLTFFFGALFLPIEASYAAALLVAFNPHLISMSSYVLTEILFSFLLLASVYCFYHAVRHERIGVVAASGVLFGFSYLTNEITMLLPFLLAFVCVRLVKPITKPFGLRLGIFLFAFSVFPVLWGIRQANLPPNSLKGSQRAISTMSHGAYPDFIYKDPKYQYFPYKEDPMQPEFSKSLTSFLKIFIERFKERPLRYIRWYLFEKPYYLWSWNILQGQGDVYVYPVTTSLYQESYAANLTRIFVKFLHPIILVLTLIGVPLIFFRIKNNFATPSDLAPVLVISIILYATVIYTIFAPWPRYSIPLRPELYLWSVWVCVTISINIKKWRKDASNQ